MKTPGITGLQLARAQARRRRRGLVYVETLIAMPVVFYFAMVSMQLTDYFGGVILAKHAAIAAARAAAVVGPDDPKYYGGQAVNDLSGGARLAEVRKAAQLALWSKKQFQTSGFTLNVNVPGGKFAMVSVKLNVDYQCYVPYMNAVCGFGTSRTIHATGMFPYQNGMP